MLSKELGCLHYYNDDSSEGGPRPATLMWEYRVRCQAGLHHCTDNASDLCLRPTTLIFDYRLPLRVGCVFSACNSVYLP